MSSAAPPDRSTGEHADACELLALVAVFELDDVGRFGRDAAEAFDAVPRLALARRAAAAMARCEATLAHLVELGGDPAPAMRDYEGVFDVFDARTEPGGWEEDVLREHLGRSIAEDFCALCSASLDDGTRSVVGAVRHDPASADAVRDAAARDTVLAARLSLWGRRVAGEALVLVQELLADHPALGRLAGDRAEVSRVLTENHASRMRDLGLTP
ncbi:ferritin-like fold-containing protein [Luteimicrobium subarcticum]|uniref:tRNA-(MS[2]IO[6]A)-hydroxylase MiaE-like protein n=1 Tax=Luteimicrobium subarcticum TaxID=620910 RepID=A0A2M8WV11_9MICO|nr:ferritin-like fold-containing protein [Luteimicrobium subarcticum]PJI94754.1 tRNA-(MS[2]IO[6]A)-hydroxylase MiaE-like protein [Luteimicrobium subarcticum]